MWVRPKLILPHERPGDYHGYCGGKDELLDDKCSCPDPLYTIQLRVLTEEVFYRKLNCTCCGLEFNPAGTPP